MKCSNQRIHGNSWKVCIATEATFEKFEFKNTINDSRDNDSSFSNFQDHD